MPQGRADIKNAHPPLSIPRISTEFLSRPSECLLNALKTTLPHALVLKCNRDSKTTPTFLSTFQVCTVCDSANGGEEPKASCRFEIRNLPRVNLLSLSVRWLCFLKIISLSFFLSLKQKQFNNRSRWHVLV